MLIIEHYNRKYNVMAFDTIEACNSWLESNDKWGLIQIVYNNGKQQFFCAKSDDMGGIEI